MNPMKEAWKIMKGDEEFRIKPRPMSGQDRREFEIRGYNPDDFPSSVPPAIQQSRPVSAHASKLTNAYHGVLDDDEEGAEGLYPSNNQSLVQSRGRQLSQSGRHDRGYNRPTTANPSEFGEEVPYLGARTDNFFGEVKDVGQQVQAMPRPTPGRVDDLSRQAGGGILAQTSGFQSKPYGRFRNRQPKMGPGGVPQGMGAFDQPRPELMQSLRQRGIIGENQYKGYPMIESWGALLKRSMCKGDDCKGCRGCKCCPKCEPQGSTCEKMGCA